MEFMAVSVDPSEIRKTKGDWKVFPIQFYKDDLKQFTEYCRERGINRCELARRILLASFKEMLKKDPA